MEKERYMVFDNQKGVLVPLQKMEVPSAEESKRDENTRAEKAAKLQLLLRGLIKETVREYSVSLNEEIRESLLKSFKEEILTEISSQFAVEREELKKLEKEHWEELEKHFKAVDMNIREKQEDKKRKKHSFFF